MYFKTLWKRFLAYANEDYVWYRLIDKTTGTELGKGVFGKRYHWLILLVLASVGFIIRHWPN